jgi:hypothetical protein
MLQEFSWRSCLFEPGFGFAGIWICYAYLLVSELPYTVSQLPSKAVSVLMQIKRHDLHRQRMRYLQISRRSRSLRRDLIRRELAARDRGMARQPLLLIKK